MRRPKQLPLLALLLLLLGCSSTPSPRPTLASSPPPTTLTDPHNHVVDVVSAPVPPEIAAGFAYAEITMDSQVERYKVVTNPEGVYRAFCIHEVFSDGGFRERLIVEGLDTGSTYEVQGLPLPGRPFSDLVWLGEDVLVFDRWAQPHYGTHYAVDVRRGVLLLASPFPDQLPTPQATPQSALAPVADTPMPTPTPLPTPTPSDLARYFPMEGRPRYVPPEAWEPPAGRQVVIRGEGLDRETLLLDNRGDTLAAFTTQDGLYPGGILWSPGKERGLVEFSPGTSTAMCFLIIDADGNRLSEPLGAYWGPVWSPDRDLLAYQATSDQEGRLYVVDGSAAVQVTSEPLSPRQCSACSTPPRWSPDGTRVALIVVLGDMGVTEDSLLCLADLEGDVSYVSLLGDYDLGVDDLHWLDNRYLLLKEQIWQQQSGAYRCRYFVFDTESGAIREVASSVDLTPTPSVAP